MKKRPTDDAGFWTSAGAILGLLLTLTATFLLLIVMPVVEVLGWAKDRCRGVKSKDSVERPELEIEE